MPAEPPVLPEPRPASDPRPAPDPRSVSDPRPAPAQRRLFTVAAGLAVVVLAGGAFVLTYDLLREFAIAGRAGERWAAAYPVMADALVVIVVLSLIVSRDAPWWSRWVRGALLLALLAGTAAIAVQQAVWGFGSLPWNPVRVGVAVAPHVMLLIAVWLWYRMIRNFRGTATTEPGPADPRHELRTEVQEQEVQESAPPEPGPPPLLPTDVEVARAPDAEGTGPSTRKVSTTQPDIVMPAHPDQAPDEAPAPDGVDASDDLPIWNWDPPSGSYRSSPTPPED